MGIGVRVREERSENWGRGVRVGGRGRREASVFLSVQQLDEWPPNGKMIAPPSLHTYSGHTDWRRKRSY